MPTSPVYPTGGEYQEALQNSAVCFKDPVLAGGSALTDSLGLPKPISGNFASVFTIRADDGRRWAVKCFTRFVADQEVRYQRISQTLAGVEKPWRVAFDYVPEGILCRGSWYPILKMEWIEASGLIPFIESHLWQPPVLADLASKFANMINDLETLGVAHGDLQHGNLLVTPARELKLIDYDGMYVPGLTQLGASEKGHANYQSPARSMNSWSSDLDHFSAWLIYGSLVALTIDPMLWTLLHQEGDEALLFHRDDFLFPASSRALALLSQCVDDRLKALGEVLSPIWSNDLEKIPALDVESLPAPNTVQSFFNPSSVNGSTSPAAGNQILQGIADWLKSIEESSQGDTSATNDPSWVLAHMPPIDEVPFKPVNRLLRVFIPIWIIALAAMVVLGAATLVSGTLTGTFAGMLIVAMFGSSAALFRRTPEVESKREVKSRYRESRTESTSVNRAVSRAEKNRRDIEQREREAVEVVGRHANDAQASEKRELTGAESSLTAQLSNIGKQTQSLQAAESTEISNALRALQEQYTANHLRGAYVRSARIQGIGQKLHSELASYGFITAYDFTGFVIVNGRVLMNSRSGARVHPNGIGETKARALDAWRRQILSRAQSTQPSSLPQAQVQAIRFRYAQQSQTLVQSEHRIRAEYVTQQRQIRERWRIIHDRLALELSQTRQSFLPERARSDLQLGNVKKDAREAAWRQMSSKRELSAYRAVTFPRYCSSIIKG
jgi:tRNA A-37 threonylcarbamoyl transferase component Bud32